RSDAQLEGEDGQLGATTPTCLLADPVEVRLNRADRDAERDGDLPVGAPSRQLPQDVLFARTDRRDPTAVRLARRRSLAAHDLVDRAHEGGLVGVEPFDDAVRAELERGARPDPGTGHR